MTTTFTLWACIDCTMLEVNGVGSPEWTEEQEEEHLAAMDEHLKGIDHLSYGMIYGADRQCEHDGTEGQEHSEMCERIDFTWQSCDLCGSRLGGGRDAFTGWIKVDR